MDGVVPPASKFRVRVRRCCTNIITRPTPNSTAEKIKIKKVKESKFRLS